MTEHQEQLFIDVYPRRPLRAERMPGAPGRPDGWSTLMRRTWHTDTEAERDWVPAAVLDAVLDAAREVAGSWGDAADDSPLGRLRRALAALDG